jgi:hypothetical protein
MGVGEEQNGISSEEKRPNNPQWFFRIYCLYKALPLFMRSGLWWKLLILLGLLKRTQQN